MLPSSSANVSKENVLQKIDQLRDLVSKSYGCNLHEVSSHLSSFIALLQTEVLSQPFTVKKHPAPNENSITKNRFFSTKKRTENSKHIRKPTSEEETSIASQLSSIEVTSCAICFKSDDESGIGLNALAALRGCISHVLSVHYFHHLMPKILNALVV